VDTLVSRSAQPASASGPKTHDTSGRLSQPELLQCDQVSVSLKTSRDISALGYPTCCKTWQDWVTERRGAWRQRVNAARLTRGSGSSSWPTVTANEDSYRIGGESQQSKCLSAMARRGEMAWTTPTPWQQEESLDSWATRKAKNKAKGYNGNGQGTPLDMQVKILGQAAPANWPTPCANDDNKTPEAHLAMKKRMGERDGTNSNRTAITSLQVMCKALHGQAAPASSSSLGSRQGLWMTPRACQAQNPPMGVDKRHHGLTHQVKHGWPTPMTLAGPTETSNVSGSSEFTRKVDVLLGLRETTNGKRSPTAGKLNPRWVETLMGLPIGWTMPSCIRPVTIAPTSCDSSETESCRPAQSERSDFLLASWPSPRAGESQQTDELSRLWVECGYKQPKTRGGKPRANNSTYDVTLETAVRGVAKAETNP
jgi:hypothetical protein